MVGPHIYNAQRNNEINYIIEKYWTDSQSLIDSPSGVIGHSRKSIPPLSRPAVFPFPADRRWLTGTTASRLSDYAVLGKLTDPLPTRRQSFPRSGWPTGWRYPVSAAPCPRVDSRGWSPPASPAMPAPQYPPSGFRPAHGAHSGWSRPPLYRDRAPRPRGRYRGKGKSWDTRAKAGTPT